MKVHEQCKTVVISIYSDIIPFEETIHQSIIQTVYRKSLVFVMSYPVWKSID
jgi:hypothetical protein